MTPAIRTPSSTETIAVLNLIPTVAAASDPVQAPVSGRGMATNRQSPQNEHFSIFALFLTAFLSSQAAKRLKNLIFERCIQYIIFRMNSRIKGTGSMFPSTASR